MTAIISRAFRLAALTAFASAFQPLPASPQAADRPTRSSLLTVKATVPAGGVVDVTDIQGRTVTGVLGGVTSDVVELIVRGKPQAVFAVTSGAFDGGNRTRGSPVPSSAPASAQFQGSIT